MPKKSRSLPSHQPPSRHQVQVPLPYARTTITIPAPLKARMEAVGGQVNWSAVASEAFEKRLSELEQKAFPMTDMPNKDDALARLRSLKNKPEGQLRQRSDRAFQLGQRWAMADAHPNELKRLEEFCEQTAIHQPFDQWKTEAHDRRGVKRVFRELTLKILGYDHLADMQSVRHEAAAFWQQRVGLPADARQRDPEWNDAMFLSGFAQGALEFWTDVKNDL